MNNDKYVAYGITLLRVSFGVMLFAHGFILKYLTFTLAGTAAFFESLGLPGALAYVVAIAETVGGILLILGIGTRWVAAALIPILLGALWVHAGNGWVFNSANGGWEYPLYLVVLSIAQVLLGEGAFAVKLPSKEKAQLTPQSV